MKRVAIGIQAHSGWGALVAVAGEPSSVEVVERRRVAIIEAKMAGAKQPYHFVREQSIEDAERYLAECAAAAERLALTALGGIVEELRSYGNGVVGCAILLASGRALPSLPRILASHPLLHTAEGEFFRGAFWRATERLGIPVIGIRERDLNERAGAVFGGRALKLEREIAGLGASVGPPWTADQKNASLAALLVLAS